MYIGPWLRMVCRSEYLFHWVEYPDTMSRLYVDVFFCGRLTCEPCKVGRNTPMFCIGDNLN